MLARIFSIVCLILLVGSCSSFTKRPFLDPATDPVALLGEGGIEWKVFGLSVMERPIYYTTFGSGDDITLLFGAFHGNERATPYIPLWMARLLREDPSLLKKGKKVVIVPIQNPDGYVAATRRNANGVDLNRNYPTENWGEQPEGFLRTISFGPSPASEPETRAVMKLMKKYPPKKIITIHQPLFCNNNDGPAGLHLAELMAEYNKYPVEPYIGFPTPGSFGTWAGKEQEIPMVTLELPRGGTDPEFLERVWQENRDAILAVINYPER